MKLKDCISFSFRQELVRIRQARAQRAAQRLILYPDGGLIERHWSWQSGFCRACVAMGYLSPQQMQVAAARYRLGMSRDNGVIFWQIDQLGLIHDGKVMYYRGDGHRDHGRHPTWVSRVLSQFYLGEAGDGVLVENQHCLFGQHLLRGAPADQAVAVVEAEKTAVILSAHFPQYLWMAVGGLTELSAVKLFPLRNRRVVLFPDTDANGQSYALWYRVAGEAKVRFGNRIFVSSVLERRASAEQKAQKIDLVDFLFSATAKSSSPLPKGILQGSTLLGDTPRPHRRA